MSSSLAGASSFPHRTDDTRSQPYLRRACGFPGNFALKTLLQNRRDTMLNSPASAGAARTTFGHCSRCRTTRSHPVKVTSILATRAAQLEATSLARADCSLRGSHDLRLGRRRRPGAAEVRPTPRTGRAPSYTSPPRCHVSFFPIISFHTGERELTVLYRVPVTHPNPK